ncbi:hypothetical protein B484DRAFT_439655, partial [Ochromonadaceae sp. CCMP2298]
VVNTLVKHIWYTYLSDSAATQICMSSQVLRNTLLRLTRLHLYGPDTFHETLVDPVKTIFMDILPRFRLSSEMAELKTRLEELEETPDGSLFSVPPPPDTAPFK